MMNEALWTLVLVTDGGRREESRCTLEDGLDAKDFALSYRPEVVEAYLTPERKVIYRGLASARLAGRKV